MNSNLDRPAGRRRAARVILVCVVSAVSAAAAAATDYFPTNRWVTATLPARASTELSYRNGQDHVWRLPIVLEAGTRYTLKARWNDGKSRMVAVIGFDPSTENYPSVPRDTTGSVAINVSGNNIVEEKIYSINFTPDPGSPGNLADVTFVGREPGQTVDIMLVHPAEPDEVVTAVVGGRRTGSVAPLPLHLRRAAEPGLSAEPASGFPLSVWVQAVLPDAVSADLSYRRGREHVWYLPVTLTPGASYTLVARWDDGASRLVSLLGYNPETADAPSGPRGTTGAVSVNVGGNNIRRLRMWKRNLTVSPDGVGTTAYISFAGTTPGQTVEIMIISPAEPDETVLAVIDGSRRGQVITTPLYIRQ